MIVVVGIQPGKEELMDGMNEYYFHGRIRELQKKLETQQRARQRARKRARRRTHDVESDIAFVNLLNRALLDILVERGFCTLDDVAERMRKLDLLDGEEDHGLDPATVADELGVERPEVDEKKRFAQSLKPRRVKRSKKKRS